MKPRDWASTLADGRVIAGLAWGRGIDVVALHGWLDNAASFSPLAQGLAKQGFGVLAVDLPGHGRSGRRRFDYRLIDGVFDVIDLLGALASELGRPPALMGHSLGGGLASLAAGVVPDLVPVLVALDGLGPLSDPDARWPERAARYWEARQVPLKEGRGRSLDELVQRRSRADPALRGGDFEAMVRRGAEEKSDGWYWRHDPKLRWPSPYRLTEGQVRATLGEIAAKTLLVRPTGSIVEDAETWEGRIAAVADIEVSSVDGGHHVHLTHPERVLAPVAAFLGRAMRS